MTNPPYDADKVYPNRRRCIWLKTELDTGVEVRGGAHIQGTCKLFSGPVYDLSCKECTRYEGWRGWRYPISNPAPSAGGTPA